MIAQSIVDILGAISSYFGLDVTGLLSIAIGVTVVVNFLKATPPFSNWIQGNAIPIITIATLINATIMKFVDTKNKLIVREIVDDLKKSIDKDVRETREKTQEIRYNLNKKIF